MSRYSLAIVSTVCILGGSRLTRATETGGGDLHEDFIASKLVRLSGCALHWDAAFGSLENCEGDHGEDGEYLKIVAFGEVVVAVVVVLEVDAQD